MRVWTVDSFADKPFNGNPAGVVIFEEYPSDDILSKIANELNLSETAFIKPIGKDHFHLRWFTPTVEVELCGHATLAASHILFQQDMIGGDQIIFDSLSGPLHVSKSDNEITLNFPLQQTGPSINISIYKKIFTEEIVNVTRAYDDVLVEFASENALRKLEVDIEKIKAIDCRGLIVTARSNEKFDFISRFFAPRVGVNEDPVTGSAHCKLAHYWQQKLNKSELIGYQASKRGGVVKMRVEKNRVFLTGSTVTVLVGNMHI